jgi:hypothetical protein
MSDPMTPAETTPLSTETERLSDEELVKLRLLAEGNFHRERTVTDWTPAESMALLAEVTAGREALRKIDAIRNSIIGFQKVNWSEHIYPLVAALEDAGYQGQEYEKSRANAGTLLEQIKAAEAEIERLKAERPTPANQLERVRDALKGAQIISAHEGHPEPERGWAEVAFRFSGEGHSPKAWELRKALAALSQPSAPAPGGAASDGVRSELEGLAARLDDAALLLGVAGCNPHGAHDDETLGKSDGLKSAAAIIRERIAALACAPAREGGQ